MRKLRYSARAGLVALLLAAVLTVGGVSATWYYSGSTISRESITDKVRVGWDTNSKLLSSILSSLNDADSNLVSNVDYRLEGTSIGGVYGAYTDGSRAYYGSMDPQSGDSFYFNPWFTYNFETKEEDILSTDSTMSYIVEPSGSDYSNCTSMYIYTTEVYLGESGTMRSSGLYSYTNDTPGNPTVPIGEYIYSIYRTKVTRATVNDDWEYDTSEYMVAGAAKSCWYEEMRDSGESPIARQVPAFDVSTWNTVDSLGSGTTADNAVVTFSGNSLSLSNLTTSGDIYFKFVVSSVTYYYSENIDSDPTYTYYLTTSNGSYSHAYTYNAAKTYSVTASDSGVTITVYKDSVDAANLVAESSGGVASFTAAANTTYYFVVSGASANTYIDVS